MTIAIPEFIELLDLPATDGLRMFLIETLEAQVKALVKTQQTLMSASVSLCWVS